MIQHVIIADDSSTARMFIQRCIEIAGLRDVRFSQAAHGLQVLDIIKNDPADLVVTDLNMPEMNGVDLLKRLKSSPRYFEIPVLVVTSAANREKAYELKQLGAYAVLSKPVSPAAIARAISQLTQEPENG